MKAEIISYLEEQFSVPVRDPLWKHIYMTKGHRDIINHKDFRFLDGLRQLGPASHVYPGAIHTRLSHSIGVFYLARQMVRAIIISPYCPPITLDGVKAFLSAALLHDIGHFPHAHTLQDFPLKDHEVLSGEIIRNGSIRKIIKDSALTDPDMTAAIIDKKSDWKGSSEILFFRNLLSSPVDPDKLDYLNRDAYFCGVPYGTQDIDFVISQIYPTREGIAISRKGTSALENVLFSKYLMYKSVYWHKSVRISTALIRKAIYEALKYGYLEKEQLYRMNDHDFHKFCSESKEEALHLVDKAEFPWKYKVIEDVCFNNDSQLHNKLTDADYKSNYESELNYRIKNETGIDPGKYDVLIDVPSRISFELPFKSETVFTRPVVDGFTEALRRIRLIVKEETAHKLREKNIDLNGLSAE
ncbi:HD domain-containing protein [Spirochaeta isovalerica]|uniref:HD superfamily phosphohydrolase n=1 Tax=Spirochaeta isovalerica TaxID=150 RepID=A0A841R3F3_9SPIO|nr:HD domain-containing protein [Spirochaeta isovalerica]MBB6478405.1 HD superfamily phosphohydrolase [Spirochaeta isovalerica]